MQKCAELMNAECHACDRDKEGSGNSPKVVWIGDTELDLEGWKTKRGESSFI